MQGPPLGADGVYELLTFVRIPLWLVRQEGCREDSSKLFEQLSTESSLFRALFHRHLLKFEDVGVVLTAIVDTGQSLLAVPERRLRSFSARRRNVDNCPDIWPALANAPVAVHDLDGYRAELGGWFACPGRT